MRDQIDRQAALDALPKKQKGIGGESWMKTYRRSGYNDCVEDCMKALQALPSVQPGWIPTSERTPEKSGNYLVTTPDGQVELRYYSTLYRWNGWVDMVAWMPLPLKWEGGQDE